jgi:hypothetical protein
VVAAVVAEPGSVIKLVRDIGAQSELERSAKILTAAAMVAPHGG